MSDEFVHMVELALLTISQLVQLLWFVMLRRTRMDVGDLKNSMRPRPAKCEHIFRAYGHHVRCSRCDREFPYS